MMNGIENLPGIYPIEGREFRYLEWKSTEGFRELFPKISSFGDSNLPSHGGILNEETVITLPTGERFFGVSFRGDLAGWDQKISDCAAANNLRVGRVIKRMLKLSDGTEVSLGACEIKVDW